MPSKLCKWGNSLGVRLPQFVTERTGLRSGDYLYISLTDAGDIVIRPVQARDVPVGYRPDDVSPKIKVEVTTDAQSLADW